MSEGVILMKLFLKNSLALILVAILLELCFSLFLDSITTQTVSWTIIIEERDADDPEKATETPMDPIVHQEYTFETGLFYYQSVELKMLCYFLYKYTL